MKITVLAMALVLLIVGCTVRGGWPRFLRPGEASDSAIRKEQMARDLAKVELMQALAKRDAEIVDLEAVGKELVRKHGGSAVSWDENAHVPADKSCDVIWLQTQAPRVRDLGWMICYQWMWTTNR